MNIALFGGTFDPVHKGHLALAQAAQQRFDLKQIHFIPAGMPALRTEQLIAAFEERYAMLALGTMGEKTVLPSLLEAPRGGEVNTGLDAAFEDGTRQLGITAIAWSLCAATRR